MSLCLSSSVPSDGITEVLHDLSIELRSSYVGLRHAVD